MTDSPKNDLQTAIDLDRLQTEAHVAFERVVTLMAEAKARCVYEDVNETRLFLREMRTTLKALRAAGLVVLPADPSDKWFSNVLGPLSTWEFELVRHMYHSLVDAFYGETP